MDRSIDVQIIMIKMPILIVGVTKAEEKHCEKMPDAREELSRSETDEGINIYIYINIPLRVWKECGQGHIT